MFHCREEFDPSGRICRVQPPLYLRPAHLSLAQRTAGAARKGETDGDGFRSQAVFGLLHGSRPCRLAAAFAGGFRTSGPRTVVNRGADAGCGAGGAGTGVSEGAI